MAAVDPTVSMLNFSSSLLRKIGLSKGREIGEALWSGSINLDM